MIVGSKGRGSNLAALAEACANNQIPAQIALVIAPIEGIPATDIAKQYNLPTRIISPTEEGYGQHLARALEKAQTNIVCLAGYMRLLPSEVLSAYKNKILNIHPALLPKFGGKGMYGRRVHEAVIQSRQRESGCTVHLVTENYDEGEIILQLKCEVRPDDTPETLAARVLSLEHTAYPQALKMLIQPNANSPEPGARTGQ